MLKIAMSAQARGWSQTEFFNEVTKTERRQECDRPEAPHRTSCGLQLKACSRDAGHALQQLEKAWAHTHDDRHCLDPAAVGLVDAGRAYPCWGFPGRAEYDGDS